MNRKLSSLSIFASFIISTSIFSPYSNLALANDLPSSSQSTTDAYTSAQQQMTDMQLRYGSLSSAMAGHYAGKQQLAIASYLAGGPGKFGSLSGLNSTDIKALSTSLPAGATVADLDIALATRGLTLNSKSFSDVSVAAAEIRSKAASLDATVAQAGMNWAQQMLRLRAPELLTPPVPSIDTTQYTSVPAEGLAFGMFMNRSLNALILNFPDVFSQVSSSGVGTKSSQEAWARAMGQAMTASAPDFNKMLPTKCGGAFLDALGGKTNQTNGCSPCVAAGRLANAQMGLIFDPTKGSTLPDSSSALNPSEWDRLTPTQRDQLVKQNPTLADALGRATASSSTGCSAAGAAVTRNVKDVLPDVLNFLNKNK
jgi:hypothetical protein